MPIDTPDAMRSREPPRTRAERLAALPRVQIPRGHLHGRLRHVVSADRLERREQVARVRELDAEHARRDERLR